MWYDSVALAPPNFILSLIFWSQKRNCNFNFSPQKYVKIQLFSKFISLWHLNDTLALVEHFFLQENFQPKSAFTKFANYKMAIH